MATILIIEDDANLRETVQLYIEREGWKCLVASEGRQGLDMIQGNHPDLVVLDIMLPGLDGFQICQQARSHKIFVPILMLTARTGEGDRIQGLSYGADDYLVKPFSVKELVARIHALLRRVYGVGYRDVSRSQGLTVDELKRQAFFNGELLDLRGKEFDLLCQFAANPGRAYSREELLERVWSYDFEGEIRIVDVYIRKLRSKIELDPAHPEYIQTVWGVGYRFKAD